MAWNPIKKILKNQRLDNAEKSAIHEIGVDDIDLNSNEKSIDWDEELPALIKPTIKNFRMCYEKSDIVKGIIEDLVIKSISGWVIEADNDEIKEYIEEEAKRLDFMSLFHEVATNNIVSGAMYHNIVKKNGKLFLRELAFDGENYRIKEIWDDETGSEIIGYKQRVKKNRNTNKDWLKRDFFDLKEELEYVEFDFKPDQIIASHFFERNGKYKGLVENVLDEAYMIELLTRMMPQVVFKQTNTMVLQGGNEQRKEVNVFKKTITRVVKAITNYHRKGVIYLPYGLEAKLIGDSTLPKIQDYISKLEYLVFVGLVSPKAIFDGSSSNRSTAVVQLDSDKSGRVLFQQFIQYKLAQWIQIVIDILLEMRGKPAGSAWVNFNPPVEVDGDDIFDENGNVSTSKPGDGLNLNSIQNTNRGVTSEA
jgi:hypothetical protein